MSFYNPVALSMASAFSTCSSSSSSSVATTPSNQKRRNLFIDGNSNIVLLTEAQAIICFEALNRAVAVIKGPYSYKNEILTLTRKSCELLTEFRNATQKDLESLEKTLNGTSIFSAVVENTKKFLVQLSEKIQKKEAECAEIAKDCDAFKTQLETNLKTIEIAKCILQGMSQFKSANSGAALNENFVNSLEKMGSLVVSPDGYRLLNLSQVSLCKGIFTRLKDGVFATQQEISGKIAQMESIYKEQERSAVSKHLQTLQQIDAELMKITSSTAVSSAQLTGVQNDLEAKKQAFNVAAEEFRQKMTVSAQAKVVELMSAISALSVSETTLNTNINNSKKLQATLEAAKETEKTAYTHTKCAFDSLSNDERRKIEQKKVDLAQLKERITALESGIQFFSSLPAFTETVQQTRTVLATTPPRSQQRVSPPASALNLFDSIMLSQENLRIASEKLKLQQAQEQARMKLMLSQAKTISVG